MCDSEKIYNVRKLYIPVDNIRIFLAANLYERYPRLLSYKILL